MVSEWRETIYGKVSADFAEDRLQTLCLPKAGIQTGPFGSQLHQEDYVPIGTPIITVEHLGENRILHDGVPRITDVDRDRLARYLLRVGDIVFSRVGSVDRRALVRKAEDGWMFSGRCLRVRPNPNKIDSGYLSYFFGLPAFKEHIRAIAVGATMPSLNTSLLSDVIILHPKDIQEQQAIAHVLGTLDDKIELNRQMNETLQAMARALFKSWFVDFDPVRAKAAGKIPGLPKPLADLFPDSFEDSELGEIPKGWEITNLQCLTTKIGSGATPRGGQGVYVEEGIALIRSQNVYDADFVWDGLVRITNEAANQLSGVEVKVDDILINITGASILRTCVVDPEVLPARVNQHVAIIRTKPGVTPRYVYWHLLQATTKDYLMGRNAGGSREAVTKGHLESVPILNPNSELLRRFQEIVAPTYAQVQLLTSQSRILTSIRDVLLPKLIFGELRVKPDIQISMEPTI